MTTGLAGLSSSQNVTYSPSNSAGGDLAGTYPNPEVVAIQGTAVAALPGVATQYLNGTGNWSTPSGSGGGGGIARSIASISTATTAGASASTDYVYFVSGTTTLTLPTAVGNTNLYTVKNIGSNTVTIATTSSQTIDGSSSVTLPVQNTSLDLVSDNSNWRIV